jgi:hypothetical protein
MVAAAGILVIAGLRDKVWFLQTRGEQYLPALVFFAAYNPTDLIVALKLLIVVVWVGAGFSKFGKHFANVVTESDIVALQRLLSKLTTEPR